jgi:hypothetical protein
LNDFYEAPQALSRTIFTTVSSRDTVDALLVSTRNIIGNLDDPDTGLLLVMPVMEAYGLNKGRNL